jgi:signal transduction histidine kinase
MRSRTSLIVALLGASFLTTAFIAVRALMASVYQRGTAERVIRDFAGLAADEFAQGGEAQITYYGCYPIVQKLAAGQPVKSPLVKRWFPIDTRGGANPAVPDDLRPKLAAALKDRENLVRGRSSTYYLGVSTPPREALPERIAGIELDPAGFPHYFENVITMRRLLPRSFAHGKLTNRDVYVRVIDRGKTLFTTPGVFDSVLGVRREMESPLFTGMTLEVSLDRRVAPTLVLGGLPGSPLTLYGAMLIVNGVLLVTAVMQLRKERALARLRSDFISGVSHELRTPLTQIRMFAETLLLDRVRSGEERKRSLTIIDQETRRLAHLVDNILQFSRGERGTLHIMKGPHDLAALVRETADAFTPIAKARGVTLALELPEESIADFDEDAMRQVLLNLLDNAVKYGPPNQRVIAGVRGRELYVDDEGPGIPAGERAVIFERYRRLDRERERAIAGMGIGLSVVRELVALHGGSVRAESGSRGGARFVVTL